MTRILDYVKDGGESQRKIGGYGKALEKMGSERAGSNIHSTIIRQNSMIL